MRPALAARVRVDVANEKRLSRCEGESGDRLAHADRVHLVGIELPTGGRDDPELDAVPVDAHPGRLRGAEDLGHGAGDMHAQPLGDGAVCFVRPGAEVGDPGVESNQPLAQLGAPSLEDVALARATHGEDELLLVEGLGEVVARAHPQRLEDRLLIVLGREHDHAQQRPLLAQLLQNLDAAHVREADVEDDHADPRISRGLHGVAAALGGPALDPGGAERLADRLAEEPLVVDDEHLC